MVDKLNVALTPLERDIICYGALGYTVKGIGKQINMSHDTVKYRLRRIYVKLGTSGLPHTVGICIVMGLVSSEKLKAAYIHRLAAQGFPRDLIKLI